MIVEEIEQVVGKDILAAVHHLGGEIATLQEITRLQAPGNLHACFRVQLTNGQTVKARRFDSTKQRESLTALYPSLEGLPFSRILSVHGGATIEEWIDGSPIRPGELNPELTHQLATLLGTLHSKELPRGISAVRRPGMSWYSDRLRDQLELLVEEGELDSRTARRLFDRATNREETELEKGIIHTDFHPRNMIMREDGEVWIIDNEDIRLGAFDYDLARCWGQWPMTGAQREAFSKAYGVFRSMDSFFAYQEFWSICTLVNSAKIHARHLQPIQSFLKPLEQLSQNAEDTLWPQASKDL